MAAESLLFCANTLRERRKAIVKNLYLIIGVLFFTNDLVFAKAEKYNSFHPEPLIIENVLLKLGISVER
jgi:hypothetical protein